SVEELVGDRECVGLLLTHAHDHHVRFAPELSEALEAPILLNPADREVWQLTHGDLPWDDDVTDGDMFTIAGVDLEAMHTPGHSPGSTCNYCEELGAVFTGDTLFQGGPGATGRSFSSRETIEQSIRERLFALPEDTVVHTGHGPDTTSGAEKYAAQADWLCATTRSGRCPRASLPLRSGPEAPTRFVAPGSSTPAAVLCGGPPPLLAGILSGLHRRRSSGLQSYPHTFRSSDPIGRISRMSRRRWTPSERPRGGGEDGRVGGGHRAAAPRATERRGGQRPVPGASASAPSPRRDPRERLPHRCASCSG